MDRFPFVSWMALWMILLHSQASAGERGWIRASSPNLEMFTTGKAALAAQAVAELESLRHYIRQEAPSYATTGVQLRIVAFSDEREYRAFRVNSHSPAYFVGGPGKPTIVLGRLAKQSLPSLRHEWIHAFLAQTGIQLPLWLEEGLADYYGGVSAERARERRRLLSRWGRLRLSELARIDRNSPWYRQPELAGRFYAESWAAVAVLMERWKERGLDAVLHADWTPDSAPFAELDHAIETAHPRWRATGTPLNSRCQTTIGSAETSDVYLTLARLQARTGDFEAARAAAQSVAADRPEAWEVLGDIAFRRHDDAAARQALHEALRLGAIGSRGLWQLAVVEQAAPDGDVVPVLERLVATDPAHDEARLVLSSHYLRQQRWRDALEQLHRIRNTPPNRSDFYRSALELAEARAASPLE